MVYTVSTIGIVDALPFVHPKLAAVISTSTHTLQAHRQLPTAQVADAGGEVGPDAQFGKEHAQHDFPALGGFRPNLTPLAIARRAERPSWPGSAIAHPPAGTRPFVWTYMCFGAFANSHGKNDHAKGKEHSNQARQQSQSAEEHSKAHTKSNQQK